MLVLSGVTESIQWLGVALVGIPFFGACLMVLTQLSLMMESRTIAAELREEVSLGIIPEAHLAILPNYFRRASSHWLPSTVIKRRYVPLATTLAFRKFQRKRCAPSEISS